MAEAQVFVKIEDYRDVLHTIGLIKDKLNEARNTLEQIKELKDNEDAELEKWNNKLSAIESRIEGIDKVLFEIS